MRARKISEDVYWVGAVDWDRRLFDALIPLPDGTSYNAYLVKGEQKTALIDTVDPSMAERLFENLSQLDVKRLDYVVINHAEQDHSGTLPMVLEKHPEAKVVTTPKCSKLVESLLMVPEGKIISVADGESLTLGGKTFSFIHAPWVHWPETMLTYLKEDNILFTCDLFGSHLAASNLYAVDEATVYEAAKRYYAEIMMPFRKVIEGNLKKIGDLQFDVVAPSHGPIHNKPDFILDAYRSWVYDPPKNEVVIPYISMHGSTEKMVNHLVAALVQRGITVKQFNLARTDIGKLAMALVDAASIVVGSPTVLAGAHPEVVYAVYLANALRPKLKFATVVGSYGWGGRMVEQIVQQLSNLKVELLEPVVVRGYPTAADLKNLDKLADVILKKHEENSIV